MTFDKSESYATIAVGYYDEDDIPDFLVKYQYGSGFPVYEYEQVSSIYLNILNLCLVHFICSKGQLISKCLIGSIVSTKKNQQIFFKNFDPRGQIKKIKALYYTN